MFSTNDYIACVFQDIIENEDIKLDDMFIASLVHDLIKVSIFLDMYFRKRYFDCEKKYIYISFLLFRVCCTFTIHLY